MDECLLRTGCVRMEGVDHACHEPGRVVAVGGVGGGDGVL
jgi:hypothetical protein